MGPRGWAVVTLIALVVAAAVVALLRVPWSTPPAPRADQLDVLRGLPADAVARGKEFAAAVRLTLAVSLGIGLLVTLGLGLSPLGARLVEAVGRPFAPLAQRGDWLSNGHWVAQALLGGAALVAIGELAVLPVAAWRETVLRRYGLSTQTWGGWIVDLLKGYAVAAVIGAVTLLAFYGVTRLWPRWWWAVASAGAALLVLLFSFVFPVLVEPIFNKFTPMPPGELRTSLLALAEHDGVPVHDVLVADASRRTTALNAYVSGLGPTRRIVVYDTLLREAPPEQVVAVVAHELGHAKRNDVLTGTLISAFGAAAGVCALFLLGSWAGLLRRAGVSSIVDPRALALLVALVTVAGAVSLPLQNLLTRHMEARADEHALQLTGDPSTVERMEERLATTNLADVDPPRWYYLIFASHPSIVERIAAARAFARGQQ